MDLASLWLANIPDTFRSSMATVPWFLARYSNVRWYVYMVQIATNVIYVKVLVIVTEICTTF